MPLRKTSLHPLKHSPGPVRIGCAGWGITDAVAEHFPGDGTHLARYSQVLTCVEINSSFYRPHRAETYARWRDSVPSSFRFSVKIPKAITHDARLVNCETLLDTFFEAATQLGSTLGCWLVQLPPSLVFDPAVAESFLHRCANARRFPSRWKHGTKAGSRKARQRCSSRKRSHTSMPIHNLMTVSSRIGRIHRWCISVCMARRRCTSRRTNTPTLMPSR